MFFNATVSRTAGRILLTSMLCVLAVAFALEAKMAWYGPGAGLKSEIPQVKAMPADMPRLVAHGVTSTVPVAPQTFLFIATVLIAATLSYSGVSGRRGLAGSPLPPLRRSSFSPFLTFRPPPVQS